MPTKQQHSPDSPAPCIHTWKLPHLIVHKRYRGVGFLFLFLFLTTSSTFAQRQFYIDPVNGKTTGRCNKIDPSNVDGPCTLERTFALSDPGNSDVFLIRVRRAGGSVTLAAPSVALDKRFQFGVYVQGSTTPVKGTIEFTGTFTIAATGQFQLAPKASVQFENVTLSEGSRPTNVGEQEFFRIADESEERITITGTLTIPNGESVRLPALVVSRSFTLKGGTNSEGKTSQLKVGGPPSTGGTEVDVPLTVQSGATLQINGVDLVIHLLKEMFVEGAIEDVTKGKRHPLRIAFLNSASVPGTRGSVPFITADLYHPLVQGFDHNDCLRIRGKGTIPAGIFAIAMGNVCVELKRVGPVTVSGSIQNDVYTGAEISTDLIFREDVIVDGDVEQWNDSRIVFAKTATIRGDVILRDGGIPYTNTDDYGQGNIAADSGIRVGWRNRNLINNQYTCAYSNRIRRTEVQRRGGIRTYHIPGVHFAGMATIAGDLNVYSNTLTETTTGATLADTKCAPRVLFMAPLASNKGATEISLTSSVGGSLVVEDTESFGDKGRVYLDSDSASTQDPVTLVFTFTHRTSHSLHVGGDLAAGGNSIGMEYPAMSSIDGMCTQNDIKLTFGNHVVLTDAGKSVVIGDATNGLTLDALVTHGDLRVEPGKGTLKVKTLHVGPDAELTANKDVTVTESLILEGELSGELSTASTIKRLAYGNRNTDLVKKATLADMLDALSIQIGSGEVRLEEVHKVKNLGLCSGTLSLVAVESTTDSTLQVTEQITVENGMLAKDLNDPGSISTDKMAKPNSADRYVLKYIIPGKREVEEGDMEWFDPRDVLVDHAKAEIMVPDDRSLPGKLTVSKGKLIVDGDLTVGTSTLHRTADSDATKDATAQVGRYSAVVIAGELHTKGQDMIVHGKVTVSNKSKLMTGGGDLQVLGRVSSGAYANNTAQVTIAKGAMIDLGKGTLLLGPEDTKKRNGMNGNARPNVLLSLPGTLNGRIHVPKGSKYTDISSASQLETVTFDGTKTPNASGPENNTYGVLRFLLPSETNQTLVLDSLSAKQGNVLTNGKRVTIKRDVLLESATIFPYTRDSLVFGGDLTLRGTGGLNTEFNSNSAKRAVVIQGNFTQEKGSEDPSFSWLSGVKLHPMTTKTVLGDFMVSADAYRYEMETTANAMPVLVVHGGFHFAKKGDLDATVEFRGEEAQEVMTGDTTALHSVVVHNPKGLLLKSHVMQQKAAMLTLRQGKIHSMPMDSMYTWTVQNVEAEQELRGRSTAQEGSKCGAENDEECKGTILRGSRQSYIGGPVARRLLQGTAGDGFQSGGYLFPVGMDHKTDRDTLSYYRPLVLQLPSDLNDTTAVTVTPVMLPEGTMPAWENLTVPTAGGSLTLDVHADLFWKVDLGAESLPTNTNIRLAAAGLRNVADASGLRIVQWDCKWKEKAQLAGRVPAQTDAESFAVNGYLNGVVNLTQEGIGLGSCAIFGVAANGIENPIDQADLSAGRANLQFIHNLPLTSPIDLHLGDIRIGSGMQFRSATAYRPVGAGSHDLKIQPAGAPAEQAVTGTLSLNPNTNTVVIAHGSQAEPKLKVLDMRMTSSVPTKAEVRLVHGSADLGAARVQVMDPTDPMMPVMTLAGNLMLDGVTRRYVALDPLAQVMQVKSAAGGDVEEFYELDLHGYGGQTLVLNLSGTRRDLTILGVDRNGEIVPTLVVTGTETEGVEIPKEFALHGNYPNPFNPSTKIQFDLPERAQVNVQIVDLLGREVMVLPAQEMEAGATRSVELNASSLASGTYLYRLVATGAESPHVKTGRMTLVK